MPREKVLAWQCPVASAIRQGRLISQSELQGGNADKVSKQEVPGPQGVGGWNHTKAEGSRSWGSGRANRCSPESPLPADLFSLYSRDHFQATLKRVYQTPRTVLVLFSDTHTFEMEKRWMVVTDN